MKFHLHLLLVLFCALNFISSKNISSSDKNFLLIARAILEGKNTLIGGYSSSSKFASWQGSSFDQADTYGFIENQGMIIENWKQESKLTDPTTLFSFSLRLFDGNKVDQKGIIVNVLIDDSQSNLTINQSNATIIFYGLELEFQDQQTQTTSNYTADLYLYIVDKFTTHAPDKFDTFNLQAYTNQFQLKVQNSSLEFSTTLFDADFQIPRKDEIFLIIGSVLYLIISIGSIHSPRTLNDPGVSRLSLYLLLFFPVYVICYISVWFADYKFVFSPFLLLSFMVVTCLKHVLELSNNGSDNFYIVIFYPLPILFLVFHPKYGHYIADIISSLYLLPQVVMRFKQRRYYQKHLTLFEIGNWVSISLWIYYMNLYPQNVFLTSPKPIRCIINSTAILIQLGVMIYLQCKYGRPAPRKVTKILQKYIISIKGSKIQEKLLSDPCVICLEGFEIESQEKCCQTPCGHFFHEECLKEWAKTQLDCPTCRTQIPESQSEIIN